MDNGNYIMKNNSLKYFTFTINDMYTDEYRFNSNTDAYMKNINIDYIFTEFKLPKIKEVSDLDVIKEFLDKNDHSQNSCLMMDFKGIEDDSRMRKERFFFFDNHNSKERRKFFNQAIYPWCPACCNLLSDKQLLLLDKEKARRDRIKLEKEMEIARVA